MFRHLHTLRHRTTAADVETTVMRCVREPSPPRRDEKDVAFRLCRTMDRALRLREYGHASRVARQARRIADRYPQLQERLARFHFAIAEYDAAIDVIDRMTEPTSSARMLQAVSLIQSGRTREAHELLRSLSRTTVAPLSSRNLAALLDWEQNDLQAANEHVQRNLEQMPQDVESRLTDTVLTAAKDRRRLLEKGRRLAEAAAYTDRRDDARFVLDTLGVTAHSGVVQPTERQVKTLALELIGAESAIPALVETLDCDVDANRALLLAAALDCAAHELKDPDAARAFAARLRGRLETARVESIRGEEVDDVIGVIRPQQRRAA